MLIKRFHLPAEDAGKLGLQEIKMGRLGRIVAIAGRNGSGKTRLLNEISAKISDRSVNMPSIYELLNGIKELGRDIEDSPDNPLVSYWEKQIYECREKIELISKYINCDNSLDFKALHFVPKNLTFSDPNEISKNEVTSRYIRIKNCSIGQFSDYCLSYIERAQNYWRDATHPGISHGTESGDRERLMDIENYNQLNDIINRLLGVELGWSRECATIFDKPISHASLSDGQKILLQLAVLLHTKNGSLDNTVFILDELENHLHPSAAIEILKSILDAAPKAQIWIATHSVPLLAYVLSIDPMALWFMDQGAISHEGRRPEKVLRGLLGDDVRIGQLSSFSGLPAQLAMTNYAVESLFPPLTLSVEKDDPQVSQISNVINNILTGGLISILDFGAGKGRLLEGLAACDDELCKRIDYYAFDEYHDGKELCLQVILDNYSDKSVRYFENVSKFIENKEENSIDVVVMCNVLHEIPTKNWIEIFSNENSMIQRSLKENGYVLVVEDQRIPVGEKAHEHGFLVLDTPQLMTLFEISFEDRKSGLFVVDEKRNGRLKAHLISKKLLRNISVETRTKSISALRDSALEKIREVRKLPANYENGQAHGFWTQQLANAHMYLSEN